MTQKEGRLICVEGCIGAGKTTWARALAAARGAKLVLEEFDKNPFLNAFYSDPVAHVLETELQFLLIHYHQLKGIRGQAGQEAITDFTFFKDAIFAELNFSIPAEKEMFFRLYEFLDARLRSADLVVFLRGSDQLILERIRQRNRSMEQEIDTAYFTRLNRAYGEYFSEYRGPHYVIDADRMDCLARPETIPMVSEAINLALGRA